MITINLRPGAQRKAKKGGPMFAGLGASLKGLTSRVKEPWLAAALIARPMENELGRQPFESARYVQRVADQVITLDSQR